MKSATHLFLMPCHSLLDEATSALDTATEKLVQETLQRAMTDRITIAVAHRLKTVVDAGQILVFDNGRIIESGTHDDLMQLGRKYFQMAKLQQLDEEN
jgi:ATP-binding cassette subfamily B (MDR/TAP) protein 1